MKKSIFNKHAAMAEAEAAKLGLENYRKRYSGATNN